MMTGPTKDVPVLIPMATRATTMNPVSGFIRGRNRWAAAPSVPVFFPAALPAALEVSSLYFIQICAPLRFVNLDVFGRCFHKMRVRSRRQYLTFHQQDDLVVILHGGNFLRH